MVGGGLHASSQGETVGYLEVGGKALGQISFASLEHQVSQGYAYKHRISTL